MPLSKEVHGIEMPYILTEQLKKQKQDAIRIIKLILADNEISDNMKEKVIDVMLWNITGIGEGSLGQYLIRFRSTNSINNKDSELRHEHVYQRKNLRKLILTEGALSQETIDNIIGCVVTKEEHEKLHKVDKSLDGWDRYVAANIEVQDMENNCKYIFPSVK